MASGAIESVLLGARRLVLLDSVDKLIDRLRRQQGATYRTRKPTPRRRRGAA
jgi:hypothetical protein